MTAYRPPRHCPVCSDDLHITALGCPRCGTGLSGDFEPCDFCGLDDHDRNLLRVFLVSRGNMKDLERHLGVSYPTARARFDELLGRLGLAPSDPGTDTADTAAAAAPVVGRGAGAGPDEDAGGDPRLETLQALALGEIDVGAARDALAPEAVDPAPPPKPARRGRRPT